MCAVHMCENFFFPGVEVCNMCNRLRFEVQNCNIIQQLVQCKVGIVEKKKQLLHRPMHDGRDEQNSKLRTEG